MKKFKLIEALVALPEAEAKECIATAKAFRKLLLGTGGATRRRRAKAVTRKPRKAKEAAAPVPVVAVAGNGAKRKPGRPRRIIPNPETAVAADA